MPTTFPQGFGVMFKQICVFVLVLLRGNEMILFSTINKHNVLLMQLLKCLTDKLSLSTWIFGAPKCCSTSTFFTGTLFYFVFSFLIIVEKTLLYGRRCKIIIFVFLLFIVKCINVFNCYSNKRNKIENDKVDKRFKKIKKGTTIT